MNALVTIPPSFQQAPAPQAFSRLEAEHVLTFGVLQAIANTDCRYGLDMKEIASTAVNRILEADMDARVEARAQRRLEEMTISS
jgi:hypothetical protein